MTRLQGTRPDVIPSSLIYSVLYYLFSRLYDIRFISFILAIEEDNTRYLGLGVRDTVNVRSSHLSYTCSTLGDASMKRLGTHTLSLATNNIPLEDNEFSKRKGVCLFVCIVFVCVVYFFL